MPITVSKNADDKRFGEQEVRWPLAHFVNNFSNTKRLICMNEQFPNQLECFVYFMTKIVSAWWRCSYHIVKAQPNPLGTWRAWRGKVRFSSILLICCLTDNNMLLSISLLALLYYKWLLIVNCVITWLFKPQLCEIASDFVEGYRPRRLAIWKSKSTFRDWGMKRLSKVNANEIIGRAFPCLRWLEVSVLQSSYAIFDSRDLESYL